MSTRTKVSWIAAGCLLLGVCAGAVGAQVVDQVWVVRYLNTGLVTLSARQSAEFHVTLDDSRTGAPSTVVLTFMDERGVIVARRDVVLQGGQSATLAMTGPALVRGHAELAEATSFTSPRRAVVGSMELLDLTTLERGPTCSIDGMGSPGGGRQ
jgi:hypothetical protein